MSFRPAGPQQNERDQKQTAMGRKIGMDIHRDFAQIAVIEDGVLSDAGQIGCRTQELRAWAESLHEDEEVALEATGNSEAIALITNLKSDRQQDCTRSYALASASRAAGRPPGILPDDPRTRRSTAPSDNHPLCYLPCFDSVKGAEVRLQPGTAATRRSPRW